MARIIGEGYSYDDLLIVPKYTDIKSRKNVCFKTKVTRNHFIDIPFLAANMDTVCDSKMAIAIGKLGGLGVLHRFCSIEEQSDHVRKVKKESLLCGAAIGLKDFEERSKALVSAGVDIFVLDIAHGHSKMAGKTLTWLKETYPSIDVMVGNIATKIAAEYFLKKGADALKVGIGPGAMCTTRIMTGCGVPQVTAIMDVFEHTQGRVPICADGGIKDPGDVVKGIGAGANCVMAGSILSGTDESPGEIIIQEGQKFKLYRGMASFDASLKKMQIDGKSEKEIISVEGEKTLVPYKGSVEKIIIKFLGGLASGMTYNGAKVIDDLRGTADFIGISYAGMRESIAHGVKK